MALCPAWFAEPLGAPKLLAVRERVCADPVYGPLWRAHGLGTPAAKI